MANLVTTQDEKFSDNDALEHYVKDHSGLSFDQKTEFLANGTIELDADDNTHIKLELQRDDNSVQVEAQPEAAQAEAAPATEAVEPGTPVADPAPVSPATATDVTTSAPAQSDAVKGDVNNG